MKNYINAIKISEKSTFAKVKLYLQKLALKYQNDIKRHLEYSYRSY